MASRVQRQLLETPTKQQKKTLKDKKNYLLSASLPKIDTMVASLRKSLTPRKNNHLHETSPLHRLNNFLEKSEDEAYTEEPLV